MGELSISLGGALGLQMEMVEYTGTGNYGASNPCNVTFSHPIKVAIILEALEFQYTTSYTETSSGKNWNGWWIQPVCGVMTADDLSTTFEACKGFTCAEEQYYGSTAYSAYNSYGKISSDKKTVSWYVTKGAGIPAAMAQFNYSGKKYHVIGIYE